MTETRRTRTDREPSAKLSAKPTMGDVSHTHPYTDRGAINRPFERGPVVVADGGRREAASDDEAEAERAEDGAERAEDGPITKMKDVDHTPPRDAESANRVFERGGKEEPVESEE